MEGSQDQAAATPPLPRTSMSAPGPSTAPPHAGDHAIIAARSDVLSAAGGRPFHARVDQLQRPEGAAPPAGVPLPPERHPALTYLAGLAPSSRRVMKKALDIVAGILGGYTAEESAAAAPPQAEQEGGPGGHAALADGDTVADEQVVDAASLPWHLVRYQHAQAVRAALAEAFAPARANLILSALRGVMKECWRLGYIDGETLQRTVDVEGVKGTSLPAGRALSDGELRALIEVCCSDPDGGPATPIGARDAALFAVIFGGGLRRTEAVDLDLADYVREEGVLRVRHGKGNKARIVPLPHGAREAIDAWLLVRGAAAAPLAEGDPGGGTVGTPLLCPVRKGGKIELRRMTAGAVLWRTERRAIEAGIRRFSPHDARRTFITGLLANGADVVTVQRLAGHSRVETTATYDRRGEDAKKKAVEGVRFPYRGRE